MTLLRTEKTSFYSHLALVPAACIAAAVLLHKTNSDRGLFITVLAYGLAGIFLFSASALYHYKKQGEREATIWRKLDHLAIFFMIAGTYTPMSLIFLNDPLRTIIIAAQWGLAGMGLLFKILFINAPRHISTAIYLAMGWFVIIPIKYFWQAMPGTVILFTGLGALAYTLGGIVYAVKKPDPRPGVFGFHEIFHLLIIMGWMFHFCMVSLSIDLHLR
jgi:hemolysin III